MVIGFFLGLAIILIFVIFASPPTYPASAIHLKFWNLYSFIFMQPAIIGGYICKAANDSTFGCFSNNLLIFPLSYAVIVPFGYTIYYLVILKILKKS